MTDKGAFMTDKGAFMTDKGAGAPPYPGVIPARMRRTGPPSSDFFGIFFLKKNSTGRKKWLKKYFFQNRFPYCIFIV